MIREETVTRTRLLKALNASVITSCDEYGYRRFLSKSNKKWGYCTREGVVVQKPQYDEASSCYPYYSGQGLYMVKVGKEEKYFNVVEGNHWMEMTNEEVVYQTSFLV